MTYKECKYCGSKNISKKMGGWLCLDCRKFEVYNKEELEEIVTDKEIKECDKEKDYAYFSEALHSSYLFYTMEVDRLNKQLLATQKKLEEYEQAHIMSCNLINSQDNKIVDLQQKLDKAEAENKLMKEGLEKVRSKTNMGGCACCFEEKISCEQCIRNIAKTTLEKIGGQDG